MIWACTWCSRAEKTRPRREKTRFASEKKASEAKDGGDDLMATRTKKKTRPIREKARFAGKKKATDGDVQRLDSSKKKGEDSAKNREDQIRLLHFLFQTFVSLLLLKTFAFEDKEQR
ncbi:hypothetical protein QYF36_019940 [Acer negundo]|nr:hypothetical protein QYF36_019940 [Acer negundo]